MRHDLKHHLAAARARGWAIQPTRSGHWRLQHPAGALVFTASTPSCCRGVRNFVAHLARVERQVVSSSQTYA